MNRCEWVSDEQIYIDYHDHEWGRPTYNDEQLFEMLCLEGAQAGLSWITILKKRENYRQAFDHFKPEIIASYGEDKINDLLNNEGIVRNKLKINSVIKNAKAYLDIRENGRSFSDYVWEFVDFKPITNEWETGEEVPNKTEISEQMSKQMKKDGFSFVGPTICYAYMQSVGMVNDHLISCDWHEKVKKGYNKSS